MERSIADALYAEAQERLRLQINERSSPDGWRLVYVVDGGFAPRWWGSDRYRNDQYEVLYDSIWELAQGNPDGVEAAALEWLRLNMNDTYRRVRAGVRDTVPLT